MEATAPPVPQSPRPVVLTTRGLTNLGNTCYFNATLQCLARARPLRKELRRISGSDLLSHAPLTKTLWTTLSIMCSGNAAASAATASSSSSSSSSSSKSKKAKKKGGGGGGGFSPSSLLERVRKCAPQFKGSSQQDAHELFMMLLSSMDEECLKAARLAQASERRRRRKEEEGKTHLKAEPPHYG